MITIDRVKAIHNKYNNLGEDADVCCERNLHMLMMFALDSDFAELDGDRLLLAKGEEPLKSIEIERITGAEDLGEYVAIVLPAAVLFVNKANGEVRMVICEADE